MRKQAVKESVNSVRYRRTHGALTFVVTFVRGHCVPPSSCVAFEPQQVNASVCFNCTDVAAVMARCCPLRSTPPVCSACKRPQERSSEQPYIPCWCAPGSDLGSSEKHHCASPVKPGDASRTTPFGTWKLDVYVQPEKEKDGWLSPGQGWTFGTTPSHQVPNLAQRGERSPARTALPTWKRFLPEGSLVPLY